MPELFIIKIGGAVIDDEKKLSSFLKDFAALKGKKILVHGGGKLANRLAEQLAIPQQVVEGRRITDAETLKIVTMVYAGYINKNIVAQLQANQCNALGLCGADGNSVMAHKRKHPVLDYGYVGDVDAVNSSLFCNLLENNFTPVMAPITHDHQGQLLNTNADTLAQELAKGLCREFEVTLVYCFEKDGVLLDLNDEASVIATLNWKAYQELKLPADPLSGKVGKITAGMIPKLDNAFAALDTGVKKIIIGNAAHLTGLVSGSSGTTIVYE